MAHRWQRPLDGNDPSMANALGSQTPLDGKVTMANALFSLEQANILFSHNHSSLGTAGSEDVALPESLGRRMLQRIKRWSSLKHYMWSVRMKEKMSKTYGLGPIRLLNTHVHRIF